MNIALNNIISVLVALLITLLVKKIADLRTTEIDDDYEIEEKSNFAVGIRRAGLYLSGFIIMSAVFLGESNGLLNDAVDLIVYGLLGYLLLFISRAVSDSVILRGIDNDKACKNGNNAVGIIEFGNYLASALIITGCIMGESKSVLEGGLKNLSNDFLTIVIFFALGQIALIISSVIYELITPFKWIDEIKQKNTSAGIMVSGFSISLGIIIRKSILGPFVSWTADLKSFGFSVLIGILALFILVPIIDKVFLPHTTLNVEIKRDKNISAVIVTQCLNIGFAVLIATLL